MSGHAGLGQTLPEDPEELRRFTALLLAEVKSQAMLIEKLRHQLSGHRSHRFGPSSETALQLQLALEASGISFAKMTAKLRLPDEEEKDKPKRRPRLYPAPGDKVDDRRRGLCSLRRLGEGVTEELEYVPGARPLFLNHVWMAPAGQGHCVSATAPNASDPQRMRCAP